MKILFVSPWFPYPADNGAKLRFSRLLQSLSKGHDIFLLAAKDRNLKISSEPPSGGEYCRAIETVNWKLKPGGKYSLMRGLSLIMTDPQNVFWARIPEVQSAISTSIEKHKPDLIISAELIAAVYDYGSANCPVIFEDLELGSQFAAMNPEKPLWRRLRGHIYWWKVRKAMPRLMQRFSGCTVVSNEERWLLESLCPTYRQVEVIPNCVDYQDYAVVDASVTKNVLIFSGSLTFMANYEAVNFFLKNVFPLIKKDLPDLQFWITGNRGDLPLLRTPYDSSVVHLGYVENIKQVIAESKASVVPILTGGGTRFKILEAMALGTPVVSTSKGAEGITVESENHLLIADSAEDFAKAVVQVCTDVHLREKLVENALQLVKEQYDWQVVEPNYLAFIDKVAGMEGKG